MHPRANHEFSSRPSSYHSNITPGFPFWEHFYHPISHFARGGLHATITQDALDFTVQVASPWGHLTCGPILLLISDGHRWRHVQICSPEEPPFPTEQHLVVAIEACMVSTSVWYTSYWNAFFLSLVNDWLCFTFIQKLLTKWEPCKFNIFSRFLSVYLFFHLICTLTIWMQLLHYIFVLKTLWKSPIKQVSKYWFQEGQWQ